ncbi:DUF4232 domain-containing protein [Rhizocola hellebori]|nr:DUF4232 domain-containing protein [Rhizocola hellebori]
MRSRVRRLGAVIAGAALVIVGGGFAASVARDVPPVPFVEHPVIRPTASPSNKPDLRPQGPPCRARDLESLWPEGGSTIVDTERADTLGLAVLVRNVGPVPCTLDGHPRAQGVDRMGKPIGPAAQAGKYLPNAGRDNGYATIEPGEPAKFILSIGSAGCGGQPIRYQGADLVLSNGFRFTIKNAWLTGSCPLKASAWEPVTSAAGQYWALEARLEAPSSVEAGGELVYSVELLNVTEATVSLNPCPVYTQVLAPEQRFDLDELAGLYHSTHRLNCTTPTIGPRGAIRYEMKLPVPQAFPTGKTLLHWMAESSPRPFGTVELTVN